MTTVIVKPTLEKRPYRLKCRFKIEPYPTQDRLDHEKVRIAEWFIRDMHKEGWEHDGRHGFTMKGPFPMVLPVTIHPVRVPSAREMFHQVRNGARFLDKGENSVQLMPRLDATEWWEYEIAGVFIRETILTEVPDPHEEER